MIAGNDANYCPCPGKGAIVPPPQASIAPAAAGATKGAGLPAAVVDQGSIGKRPL